jgi:DNA-directed RNA polymerase specialized sigma24 family protein
MPALAGRIAAPPASLEAPSDPELTVLIQRLAGGDLDVLRAVAERLAPRVRRVACALMGPSPDADDAAQHALIEILRSYERAPPGAPVERWADRVAALSVLRFARAVRRRSGPPTPAAASAPTPSAEPLPARTFEQYLCKLSDIARELLLLRHALGFRMADLPEALRCSSRAAKERALSARRELRALVRPRQAGREPSVHVQRWCALRDREAVEESLSSSERDELARLEAEEPEIWAYVAQVRALELYFASHAQPLRDADRALVEAALGAVQVTSTALLAQALRGGDETALGALELEEGGWSRPIALAGSALLALGCALALLLREPATSELARPTVQPSLATDQVAAELDPGAIAPRPTVEPLTHARSAQRGPRLRRDGRLLASGSSLGQSDTIEATERPGCIVLAQESELCLAAGSALRIESLLQSEPRVLLLRGRLVARARSEKPSLRLALQVSNVSTRFASGIIGFERSADGTSVHARALRGRFELQAALRKRVLEEGSALVVHAEGGELAVGPVSAPAAQRDWELLAQASPAPPPSAPSAPSSTVAASAPAASVPRTGNPALRSALPRVAPAPRAASSLVAPAPALDSEAQGAAPSDVPAVRPGEGDVERALAGDLADIDLAATSSPELEPAPAARRVDASE